MDGGETILQMGVTTAHVHYHDKFINAALERTEPTVGRIVALCDEREKRTR